jgi:alkylation response protein AidB-like acyl-CoA dehydrogenase
MDFTFTEEQNMLKDSVTRFVQDNYDFDSRCKIADSAEGFSRDYWNTFAELGWLSIPFSEEQGGFGGGVVDNILVMEELGKALVLEPYLATVVLFGGLLSKSSNAVLQEQHIASIIDGSLQGAFAYTEPQSRFALNDVQTQAKASAGGFVLTGKKVMVLNGASADKLIVSARTSGESCDTAGISLFLVDKAASGVSVNSYRTMDGQCVANIVLENVEVSAEALVSELGQGYAQISAVIQDATVAVSAEALGAMSKLLQTTVEYTKAREQFGVAISTFQVLQHRMVDIFSVCEEVRSLLYRAACSVAEGSDDAEKNVMALKVKVGNAGKHVGGEAMQLHGGMGMTDELDVGHYAKRLRMINSLFGDSDYCQQRFAQLTFA